jgi:hypothetical protein
MHFANLNKRNAQHSHEPRQPSGPIRPTVERKKKFVQKIVRHLLPCSICRTYMRGLRHRHHISKQVQSSRSDVYRFSGWIKDHLTCLQGSELIPANALHLLHDERHELFVRRHTENIAWELCVYIRVNWVYRGRKNLSPGNNTAPMQVEGRKEG